MEIFLEMTVVGDAQRSLGAEAFDRVPGVATISISAVNNHNCIADSVPSNLVPLRIGTCVTSHEDDQAMSGVTHQPDFEPINGVGWSSARMTRRRRPLLRRRLARRLEVVREGKRLLNRESITYVVLTYPPLMMLFSKQQAGDLRQRSLTQIWPQQKPCFESKTKENEDKPPEDPVCSLFC